jgi:hypothetical protein
MDMAWEGGLEGVSELFDLLDEAQANEFVPAEAFESVPPWNKITDDQNPVDFFSEIHPKTLVGSVSWECGAPGLCGVFNYIYMSDEDQSQASGDIDRLQNLVAHPPAFSEAARRSRVADQYGVEAESADPIKRAYALSRMGLLDEAIACSVDALRESPRQDRAWFELAGFCAIANRKHDCFFALKQAIYLNDRLAKAAACGLDFIDLRDDRGFRKITRRLKRLERHELRPGRYVRLGLPGFSTQCLTT